MPEKKPIPVRLGDDVIKRIDAVTDVTGMSRASLIRFLTQSFLDHFEANGGVATLPHNWEEILRLQDGRAFGQQKKNSKLPKAATKAKRAHATDASWIFLDRYECSAGHPLTPDSQPIDQVRVPRCFDLPGAFVLQISGDSMNAAKLKPSLGGPGGIQPGDRVVMQWIEHRQPDTHNIVAACIAGGCTLKRLHGSEGARWLEPESTNPAHRRIDLSDDTPGLIQAVLIGKLPTP